jgi:arsenate reductase
VFTVCDQAAAEPCPIWPGRPATAHWGVPDPAAVGGSDDNRRRAFSEAFETLRRRIEIFAGLPLHSLDESVLERELRRIGHL